MIEDKDKIRVSKRDVPKFYIGDLELTRDDAIDVLYGLIQELEVFALFPIRQCDNRFSHKPHIVGDLGAIKTYCTGRSTDAT